MENKIAKQKIYAKLTRNEILYLLACFLIYLTWAVMFLSLRYGADEKMRLDIPRFIFQNGRLPFGWEESLRDPEWGLSYGFGFSLVYPIGALFMKIMSFRSVSDMALMLAARMTSVLCGVGVAFYAIQISKKLFSSRMRWLFIVLMTMLPQVVHLSSYFNRDIFGLLTITMIIYSWLCGAEDNWLIKSCLHLALSLGLCFLSYEFEYSFIFGSFILYILWYVKNRKSISFKEFLLKGLLIIGVVFLISGWMFIRNAIIYDGDFLSLSTQEKYKELYAVSYRKDNSYNALGYSFFYALQDNFWVTNTCRSFISIMGQMNVDASLWVYAFYRLLMGFAGVGLIISLVMKKGKSKCNGLVLTALIISSVVTFFLSVYYSWGMDIQPQGRYIIGILPLFVLFISKGIEGIGRFVSEGLKINEKKMMTGIVIALSLIVLLTDLEGYLHCTKAFGHPLFP